MEESDIRANMGTHHTKRTTRSSDTRVCTRKKTL